MEIGYLMRGWRVKWEGKNFLSADYADDVDFFATDLHGWNGLFLTIRLHLSYKLLETLRVGCPCHSKA
ncbi:MAG: hypothetical protein COA73_18570 [Candidatus Hydrogenedentota bacterium]|nr:MAG: hypothetical protein COA73_18570 [Candidatus Hydrogenedentota bacterium]